MLPVSKADVAALIRDKYAGDAPAAALQADVARLAAGEPLAYVVGWQPFLGLQVGLGSRPLIPRPETEHWTEALLAQLAERFAGKRFRFLDLCAGSGAIGLAVLARCPGALVYFGELDPAHVAAIRENVRVNGLDESRADARAGDLFAPFRADAPPERFDVIAANPPYIPSGRVLEEGVARFEPEAALFSGADGLDLIRRIAVEARAHLCPDGALWLEADTSNVEEAASLLRAAGAAAAVHSDQYGRPRYAVSHW